MDNIAVSLHSRVHTWIDAIGFRLNASQTNQRSKVLLSITSSKPSISLKEQRKMSRGRPSFYALTPTAKK